MSVPAAPDSEDALCTEFAETLNTAVDEIRDLYVERFQSSHVDVDVATFQVFAKLLGEYEGRLLVSDAVQAWIHDMRACGIAEGLEQEIQFHRESCTALDGCATLDRLLAARKRYNGAIAKVEAKHRTSDALLEEMLSAFRSVQKARG